MTNLKETMQDGTYFEKYEKMIYKLAWKLSQQHKKDVDDLVAEAHYHLVRLCDTFDESKSSLCTWTYSTSWNKMKSLCINQKINRHLPTDFSEESHQYVMAKESWLSKFVSELSEEAVALVRVILEAPEELAHEVRERAPVQSKKAIRDYMIDAKDWNKKDIKKVFSELESCLS